MIELKKCPFCGSAAHMYEPMIKCYCVVCVNSECSCRTIVYRTKEKAAKAWNRRVEDE